MSTAMSKEERIKAAIAGEETDVLPYSFWSHLPGIDLNPEAIAEETYGFYKKYDIDLVKTMNNGMYSVEDFACAVDYSAIAGGGVARVTETPVKTAGDWDRIEPVPIEKGALKRELSYLERLMQRMRHSRAPVVFTVFSPITTADKLSGGKLSDFILEGAGERVKKALAAIAESTARLAARAIELGAAGVFFASQMSNYSAMNDEVYLEYGRPYDLLVLQAAETGWCNILHAHGGDILFDVLKDYPVQIFNWHAWESLPDVEEAAQLSGKCLLGGIERMDITRCDRNKVRNQIYRTVKATGGRKLILAPGCVIRHPLDDRMLSYVRAAKQAVERSLRQKAPVPLPH